MLTSWKGFKFEMGGTWVHHSQPYTFRELQRYGLDRDLTQTRHAGYENDYFSLKVHGSSFAAMRIEHN